MNKRKNTFSFRLLYALSGFLLAVPALAGNDNYSIGGRGAGMGNASVTMKDLWAVQSNQAGLANMENIAVGIYGENKYLVKELNLAGVAFVLPTTSSGVFGLSYTHFGSSLYSEQKVGLAYSKSFGDHFSVGVQLDYLGTHIDGEYRPGEAFGTKSAVAGEVGLQADLTKNFRIGAHIFNPTRAKLTDYVVMNTSDTTKFIEKSPTIMRLGVSYVFSAKVTVSIESEKDLDAKNMFKAGLEYHVIEALYLRAGVRSNPSTFNFGFGLDLGNFKIDCAESYHPVLGYSTGLSLQYEFK